MKISIASLRLDGGTQPRETMDWDTVEEYADELRAGVSFPPVVVFCDGIENWLADGFHRVNAAQSAGLTEIDADIKNGTKEDAVWFACGANQGHGIRRTNPDKRRAATAALKHQRSKGLSDRAIAEHCGISNQLVANVRAEIYPLSTVDSQLRKGKDGRKTKPSSKKRSDAARQRHTKQADSTSAPAEYKPQPVDVLNGGYGPMRDPDEPKYETEYDHVADMAMRTVAMYDETQRLKKRLAKKQQESIDRILGRIE